jgi:hypothetical protein
MQQKLLCFQAVVLQQALHQIPSPTQEVVIRNLSARLAMQLLNVGAAYMPNQVKDKFVYNILETYVALVCKGQFSVIIT